METTQEREFERLPDGQHVMGLQAIKAVTIKGFKGFSKIHNKEVSEPDKAGFRFVFRSLENPNAFASWEATAFYNEKAKLYQMLVSMCPGSLLGKIQSHEEATSLLKTLPGGWFLVTVASKTTSSGRPWQNVLHITRCPHQLVANFGSSHEYFASLGGPSSPPVDDDLMGQFLTNMPRGGKRAVSPANGVTQRIADKPTGFEDYFDHGQYKAQYPYCYDIAKSKRVEAAQRLCMDCGGIPCNPDKTVWRTKTKVLQLEKYLDLNLSIEEEKTEDNIPW